MKYASVCSGVEAASLAWMPLGWQAVWFSEIEPFPCAVLKERFPTVPNLGDMTKIQVETKKNGDRVFNGKRGVAHVPGGIDLLVGGTPCQDASVAGKRKGLIEGARSRLAFDFTRLAYESRAKYVVWENVPGCFSLNGGRDFAAFLSSLAGWDVAVPAGGWKSGGIARNATDGNFGLAWRVLDAQYVRVDGFPRAIPQRRRRIILVGCFGDWERAASILFDGEGGSWDTPPVRTKRKAAAGNLETGAGTAGRPWDASGVNPTLNQCSSQSGIIGASNQELFGQNANGLVMSIGNGQAAEASCAVEEACQTLNTLHDHQAVLIAHETGPGFWQEGNVAGCLCAEGENRPSRPSNIICRFVACTIDKRFGDNLGLDNQHVNAGCPLFVIHGSQDPVCNTEHANAVNRNNGLENCICQYGEVAGTLEARHDSSPCADRGQNIVCYENHANDSRVRELKDGVCQQLTARCGTDGGNLPLVQSAFVRRLMPIECERLMGFPDNWTRIPWRGKPAEDCPDGPRYKACGNSMCVNVMRWIGMRIELAERKTK